MAEQLGVAMEQRKELPAALRAFVRRSGRMDGGGTLLYAVGLLAASTGLAAVIGPVTGFATLVAGVAIAPVAFAVSAARKLVKLGFAMGDLPPAFRAEIESAREERAVEHGFARSSLEATLAWIARVTGSYTLIAAPLTLAGALSTSWVRITQLTMPISAIAAFIAATSGITYLAVVQQRRDVDTEFWARFWRGRVGILAFSIARRLRGTQSANAAMTHRATELSLGMAAEQLYESLPKPIRQSLGDLPMVLARLQQDAQRLRARYDELNDALVRLSTITASEEYETLRSERELVHEKLGDAVGALETLRLNLLRLHAGTTTVEGVTTHLGIAADVSAEVERLIAARSETERHLEYPRRPQPTPV